MTLMIRARRRTNGAVAFHGSPLTAARSAQLTVIGTGALTRAKLRPPAAGGTDASAAAFNESSW
jgi:hypothetical protein